METSGPHVTKVHNQHRTKQLVHEGNDKIMQVHDYDSLQIP